MENVPENEGASKLNGLVVATERGVPRSYLLRQCKVRVRRCKPQALKQIKDASNACKGFKLRSLCVRVERLNLYPDVPPSPTLSHSSHSSTFSDSGLGQMGDE